MTDTSQKLPPTSKGELEFELIDVTEARLALHQVPDGLKITDDARPGEWKYKRRAKLPTDRALLGQTLEWISSLAPSTRPLKLADEAPRLANALAQRWADADQAIAYIDELLIDRRGGRRGLAPALRDELLLLRRIAVAIARESGEAPRPR